MTGGPRDWSPSDDMDDRRPRKARDRSQQEWLGVGRAPERAPRSRLVSQRGPGVIGILAILTTIAALVCLTPAIGAGVVDDDRRPLLGLVLGVVALILAIVAMSRRPRPRGTRVVPLLTAGAALLAVLIGMPSAAYTSGIVGPGTSVAVSQQSPASQSEGVATQAQRRAAHARHRHRAAVRMKRSLRSFVVALKRTRDGEQWPSTLAITSDGRIFAPLSDSPEAVVGVVPRHTRLEYRVSEDLRFVSLYLRSTTHPRRVVAYDSETDRLF